MQEKFIANRNINQGISMYEVRCKKYIMTNDQVLLLIQSEGHCHFERRNIYVKRFFII